VQIDSFHVSLCGNQLKLRLWEYRVRIKITSDVGIERMPVFKWKLIWGGKKREEGEGS